jgi:hypothetical protein
MHPLHNIVVKSALEKALKDVASELVESDGRIMQKINLLNFFALQQRARWASQ